MASGRTTVAVLVAILLAAIGVAAVVFFVIPSDQTPTRTPTTTTPQRIDTTVLQRSDYTGLDASLLQQGALPVQPPPTTGKANPFL